MSGVFWDIIFLIAAAMPLSSALTADGTRIKEFLMISMMTAAFLIPAASPPGALFV